MPRTRLHPLLSRTPGVVGLLLAVLPTLATAGAPPAAPSDARGAFAVYCSQTCGDLALPDAQLKPRLPREARRAAYTLQRLPAGDFGLPSPELLVDLGRGQVEGMGEAQEVVILSWAGPSAGAARRALVAGEQALAAGQWVEDLDTGLIYDRDSFDLALDGLRSSPIDATSMAVVRSEEGADGLVMRTAGLRRLGLPELVVGGVQGSDEAELAIALNATAQAIAEDGLRGEIRVGQTRRAPAAITGCSAVGRARLSYARGRLDDGVGVSAAVSWKGSTSCEELADGAPSTTLATEGSGEAGGGGPLGAAAPSARPSSATPDLALPVGPTSSPGSIPALSSALPSSLEEAQTAAHARLRGPLAEAFKAGALASDQLFVKAPFTTSEERVEWLWVELHTWGSDDVLAGTVATTPRLELDLFAGDEVEVPVDYVFDYLWRRADGSQEGNRTGPFVQ